MRVTGMVANAALILALGIGPAPSRSTDYVGYAVRYAPHVMSRVARNRGITWQPHMAAYTYARGEDMGHLWLHIVGPAGEADFLVVDLPQPRDRAGLIRRGVIAELDYQSGFLICGKGWTGKATECKIKVRVLR